jgi:hypothetical protein
MQTPRRQLPFDWGFVLNSATAVRQMLRHKAWKVRRVSQKRLHILKSFLELVQQCLTRNLHHVQLILCDA